MGIGLDLPSFVGQLVSLLVLLVVLSRYGYPPVRRVMEERARRVREGVEQVEAARVQYERVRAEAEEELKRARHQSHLIMVQVGTARDRLLEEAQVEARRASEALLQGGRAQIAEERKMMVEQLRRRGPLSPRHSMPIRIVILSHVRWMRKLQRYCSQPFYVAERFTGLSGKYVPIEETVRGFSEILEGKHDDLPESAFWIVGSIDEAVERAHSSL